jgi:hypothetical protein
VVAILAIDAPYLMVKPAHTHKRGVNTQILGEGMKIWQHIKNELAQKAPTGMLY